LPVPIVTHKARMPAELKSTSHGQTMVLTLSNPEHRNALGPEIYAAGVEALSVAESSADIRSVVITGEGSTFCAGGNLLRLRESRQLPADVPAQSVEGLHNWIEAIHTFPKPVIAAVEGAAAGAGFSLALACDMVVAARNAIFVMAYSSVALSPDGGASWSLSRALPRQLATELLMMGDRIGADRLHALGVVNRLVDAGQALAEALSLAEQRECAGAERTGEHQRAGSRRRRRDAEPATAPRAQPLRQEPLPRQRGRGHRRFPGQGHAPLRVSGPRGLAAMRLWRAVAERRRPGEARHSGDNPVAPRQGLA
jgi:enoyl-CoA hydratase/carnithine racemase